MRKTIPKFVITAVAFLALPRVYGMEPSQYLNQLAKQKDCSAVKDLLNRRVHTSTRNAIETTLMKENTEEGQEAVIPNNFPNELIRIITDHTVAPTVYEMANKSEKMAYGLPIEFNIDPSLASRLLTPMATQGETELVRMLLNDKANVNVRGDFEHTPIMEAVKQGHAGCTTELLRWNADVNVQTSGGETALGLAAYFGRPECLGKLLDAGADVNATFFERTPLMLAAFRGKKDCVRKLLKAGADVDILCEGLTAVGFAEEAGHEDIVTLIQTRNPPEGENPDNSVIV